MPRSSVTTSNGSPPAARRPDSLVPAWQGEIAEGKLHLWDREGFRRYVESLEGQPIVITLSVRQDRRSPAQNAYFHAVCKAISEHTGYEMEEVKAMVKRKFLQGADDKPRSTASLTTREMAELTDRVIRWAATEIGLVIPSPR